MQTLSGALGLATHDAAFWTPLLLVGLFFLATVAATILDGFDIGVGCLLVFGTPDEGLRMMGLLGPWRDANGFWLFLGLGLLATAFPIAWSAIMAYLFWPMTLLALGILLRTAAFELRLRAPAARQPYWMRLFALGSWLTALSHGLILAAVASAYGNGWAMTVLAFVFAGFSVAAYALLGASWLVLREQGSLRRHAAQWGRRTVRWTAAGTVAVSVVLGLTNTGVFLKWGREVQWTLIACVWSVLFVVFVLLELQLGRLARGGRRCASLPFHLVVIVFLVVLAGLAYSYFPYLVLDNVTVWDATVAAGALRWVLWAALLGVPVALGFNLWVYRGLLGPTRPRRSAALPLRPR